MGISRYFIESIILQLFFLALNEQLTWPGLSLSRYIFGLFEIRKFVNTHRLEKYVKSIYLLSETIMVEYYCAYSFTVKRRNLWEQE